MNDNEDLVFYYDQDERIRNASKVVQAHYDGTEAKPPRGLFKALVATKASRYSLFALILVLALFLAIYFLASNSYEDTMNGVKYTLTSFSFEDKVYVSLKMENYADNIIEVQIDSIDNDNQICDTTKFTQSDIKESHFRTIYNNHDIIRINASIKDKDAEKEIQLWCKVQEK